MSFLDGVYGVILTLLFGSFQADAKCHINSAHIHYGPLSGFGTGLKGTSVLPLLPEDLWFCPHQALNADPLILNSNP